MHGESVVLHTLLQVARAQQLKQLFSSSPTKGPPGSPVHNTFMQPTPHNSPVRRPGAAAATQASGIAAWQQQADPFRAVQWQLLADVDAVRKRQKAGRLLVCSCRHHQLAVLTETPNSAAFH